MHRTSRRLAHRDLAETSLQALKIVKEAVRETPVFANTGVNLNNVIE
ncbi:MAG: hypothetical protein K8R77_06980 [Anaerolineaceae bacterium]|nr:hypothetical protein [Anaerolineaceae bacterium]